MDLGDGLWLGRSGELDSRAENGDKTPGESSNVGKGNASLAIVARASGVGVSNEPCGVENTALSDKVRSTGKRRGVVGSCWLRASDSRMDLAPELELSDDVFSPRGPSIWLGPL